MTHGLEVLYEQRDCYFFVVYLTTLYFLVGAWDRVVIKALRYKSEGPGIDSGVVEVFSMASDSSMCPGVDSSSKNEYQVNPGVKTAGS
jgi:hypothetical protein